jgi:hypothetical protein
MVMLERLPKSQAIFQVYAVIAVMISGWTMIAFLRKLPSWLLTLNVSEILTVFSYAMVTNLLESLIVLSLLLALCVLLPPQLLRDDFVVRGTLLAMGFVGSLIVVLELLREFGIGGSPKLLFGALAIILLTAFLLVFSSKFRFVQSAVLWVSDRLMVFLFILLPLYAILFVYVILRNIT